MKIADIHYNKINDFLLHEMIDDLLRYQMLSCEVGMAAEGKSLYEEFIAEVEKKLDAYQALTLSAHDAQEPDDLESIRALRPDGPRRMLHTLPKDFSDRLRGAFYGRMAGCTLGAALEFRGVDEMQNWAEHFNQDYPLKDYWKEVYNPLGRHYIVGRRIDLSKNHMDAVPPDDDTIYTLLGLLTMEQYGMDFTQEDMVEIWKKYLPLGSDEEPGLRGCWWGERKMLRNLLGGVQLPEAGIRRNPNLQNIAAWTRADSYGYVLPGWPEKAAELAWRDASVNHRRNGVYGSMFMAATISAAFVVDDVQEAIRIGLSEIPSNCLFAEGIRWALEQRYSNYREAARAVWEKYDGMFNGSALTNALHVVMGLSIGGKDFTKVIGETVAMSGDNDCTGATAGSIAGAIIGYNAIPEHWVLPFRGRMHIYLNELPEYLDIESVCGRLEALAKAFVGR